MVDEGLRQAVQGLTAEARRDMLDEPLPPLWGKVGMGGAAAQLSRRTHGNSGVVASIFGCVLTGVRAASPPIQLRLSSLRSPRLRILPPQGGKKMCADQIFIRNLSAAVP